MVRLEPHILNLIQERSQPRERGRGGGVSQYLRQLVYQHLGLGEPPCFAELGEPIKKAPRRPEPPAAPELA